MENYCLSEPRYEAMNYRRCGRSGLLLPEISLGFWHNFGEAADPQRCRAIVETAFDNGITYFDLANNYGPPAGSAEEMFGRIFDQSLRAHRDEIIVATKAGHDMWPGPYGEWSSRKSLVASLDQSLKRLRLDYVDIFIPIARTRTRRSRRRCRPSWTSSAAARRSTRASPSTRPRWPLARMRI